MVDDTICVTLSILGFICGFLEECKGISICTHELGASHKID